jgi:WD40 repeat protein
MDIQIGFVMSLGLLISAFPRATSLVVLRYRLGKLSLALIHLSYHSILTLDFSQDKTVLIWTQDTPTSKWVKKSLRQEKFPDVVWRVSWSLSGNILAVSSGDNKVTLWKENLSGDWECVSELEENA